MTWFGSHGPPDDPSNRPTRIANYNSGDLPPSASDDSPEYAEAAESAETAQPEGPPDPWYRKRVLLVAWATVVAILVVLIIYGLIQLSHGTGGGPEPTTPSTTPSSTPSGSTTTSPTSEPSTTTPAPSSTLEEQPPPNGNAPPPAQAPPSAQPPEHHHHLPHIPPTISLPHTVITLPHGF